MILIRDALDKAKELIRQELELFAEEDFMTKEKYR